LGTGLYVFGEEFVTLLWEGAKTTTIPGYGAYQTWNIGCNIYNDIKTKGVEAFVADKLKTVQNVPARFHIDFINLVDDVYHGRWGNASHTLGYLGPQIALLFLSGGGSAEAKVATVTTDLIIEVEVATTGRIAAINKAIELAEAGCTQGATAHLTMANGESFIGVSSRAADKYMLTDEMLGIVMNAGREGTRSLPPYFGGCAELSCIQQARAAGYSWSQIRAATMEAFNIGNGKIPGSPKPICDGCLNVMDVIPKE